MENSTTLCSSFSKHIIVNVNVDSAVCISKSIEIHYK